MKKLILIFITVTGLIFSGYCSPKHKHHVQHRHVPVKHHRPEPHKHGPVRHHHSHKHHNSWIIPAVAATAGIISYSLLGPQYVWVEGRYETVTTVLPNGQTVTTTVWKPGYWIKVR
jgi:hypothetical protein